MFPFIYGNMAAVRSVVRGFKMTDEMKGGERRECGDGGVGLFGYKGRHGPEWLLLWRGWERRQSGAGAPARHPSILPSC